MTGKSGKAGSRSIVMKPTHENLPWPGLKAKDHLSRVVTRGVKEAKEKKETELWAKNQIARLLDHVAIGDVMRLISKEKDRRRKSEQRTCR